MKAILFTAAALTAGICAADVSSANTVGYLQPENFKENFTMFGPMFGGIGTQNDGSYEFDIQNIKPTGEVIPDGSDVNAAIQLQFLDDMGGMTANCFWLNGVKRRKSGKQVECTGWYPATGADPFVKTFKAGDAFWASFPAGAKASLQFSGEVASGEVYIPLALNFNAVCNPNPVDVDIQAVLPAALDPADVPDGSDVNAAIQIQYLDDMGGMTSNCFWLNGVKRRKSGKQVECTGWYPATGADPFVKTLKAGEGIWVSSPNDKCSLVFPSAFAKGEVAE